MLNKPNDQDAVASILNTIGQYFNKFEIEPALKWRDISELIKFADSKHMDHEAIQRLIVIDESLKPKLKALFKLSMISETLVDPIFGMTDAIGSVMRKKIEHVVTANH